MDEDYKYLDIIWSDGIDDWDTNVVSRFLISSKYQIYKLEQYITEQNKKYDISNPNNDYKILGVNNQMGIFDAYIESGSKINQKYKKMQNGWIAYNPYRVNVGSIGIKKELHRYEYISPAYVVFSCNEKLNPDFLFYLMRTSKFNKTIRQNTTGTVRQNLSFDNLKKLDIPIPDLPIQLQLIGDYNRKIVEADSFEQQICELEQNIQDYLNEMLEINMECEKGLIDFLFKEIISDELDRWDVAYFMPKNDFVAKYSITTLDECLDCFMADTRGKSLRVETNKTPDDKFSYIGMENIEKETGILSEFQYVNGKEIKSQTIRVPQNYFLYGKLRPYLNKYWYNETDENNIVCSSEFFVFSIKKTINPYYFKYYISSNSVQKQIEKLFQGARMPRINEQTFKSIKIPLPPIEIQDEIAKHISDMKQQIQDLKQQAINLRKSALEDFENEIFE